MGVHPLGDDNELIPRYIAPVVPATQEEQDAIERDWRALGSGFVRWRTMTRAEAEREYGIELIENGPPPYEVWQP